MQGVLRIDQEHSGGREGLVGELLLVSDLPALPSGLDWFHMPDCKERCFSRFPFL